MNSIIIPLALGYILGNEKARNQIAIGLQQLTGQGIDILTNMEKQGDQDAEQPKSD